MIENDIWQLDQRPLDRSLDTLEADIWRGVAARAQRRQVAGKLVSVQWVVMFVALFGSVAAGVSVGRPNRTEGPTLAFTTGSEFTPSSLLLGDFR